MAHQQRGAPGYYRQQQKSPPATHSEIIFTFDYKGVKQSYDQKNTQPQHQACKIIPVSYTHLEVSQRYIELYEHITGLKFQPAPSDNLERRIELNLLDCINNLEK